MSQNIKIALLGCGGKTGRYLVNHLISKGYHLKVLLRDIPQTNQVSSDPFLLNLKNPQVEIVEGDAVHLRDIRMLLTGCQAVISTIGQRPGEPMVASAATENILQVMKEYGIHRYLLVAGINVDTPADKKSEPVRAATDWMKNNYPEIHNDRARAYELLVHSASDWTLVRLPVIQYTDESFPVAVSTEDCRGSKISTSDIAVFLEGQLHDRSYVKQAPFLYNV